MKNLLLAVIPVFVAVDAIGTLPLFVSLTHGVSPRERSRVVFLSMGTALCLAVGFIFLGKAIFNFLGITVADFMVAGGVLLFCIAVLDILEPNKQRKMAKDFGVVPLGTPLIVGPAVLTTSLIIMPLYGIPATLISVLLNILLAGIIFLSSNFLIKALGDAGSRALSKFMSLLLAAIAVRMIRKGIMLMING